jgi:hypothetical protein
MSLQLSGNGVVTGLDSVGSSDLGTVLGSKLDLAGGKIMQIVRATDSTDRSTTSTSFVDASISVTITPQKNDSAILLLWTFQTRFASGDYIVTQISDASNNNLSGNSFIGSTTALDNAAWPGINVGYSTPTTTNATTYKGRFRSENGSTALIFNSTLGLGQLYALEVSA